MMDVLSKCGFGLTDSAWSLFSGEFLVFLAVSVVLYYVLPKRIQWVLLLAASVVFYIFAGTPYTIIYLLLSTLITWKAACWISSCRKEGKDKKIIKRVYFIALLANVLILAVLKYTNFFLGNVSGWVSFFVGADINWSVSWIAALGISYYTLQVIAYLTDCYWDIIEPQRNYAKFLLFSCFFPQMISGPISRYKQLAVQLYAEHRFKRDNLMCGLIRIVIGFFKKLVIAENFARLTQYLLNDENAGSVYGIYTIFGVACYVIVLYGDFAGCMDIVLGAAKCFGIDMTENFNRPFASVSIQEFWQRWHVTLGTWLKDYVMYPLLRSKSFQKIGKRLKKKVGKQLSQRITTYSAMLILWLCMGLWHGGGWNYIVEGVWFWLVIVFGQVTEPFFNLAIRSKEHNGRLMTLFRQARTTCIYAVGAVFFRGPDLIASIQTIRGAFSPSCIINSLHNIPRFIEATNAVELNDGLMLFFSTNASIGFLLFVLLSLWEGKYGKVQDRLAGHTLILQITSILGFLFVIAYLGVYGSGFRPSDFIYGGF